MATKKTEGSSEVEATSPETPTPRKRTVPKEYIIRNLRGTPVHVRLGNLQKDPYRIELAPRGLRGDVSVVPAKFRSDTAFARGAGVLFEIVTKTEANEIQYSTLPYDLQRPTATLYREEDTVIVTEDDFHSEGRHDRQPQRRAPGQNIVGNEGGISGADQGLANQFAAEQAVDPFLPAGAFPTKVTLTKTTEAENAALRNQQV